MKIFGFNISRNNAVESETFQTFSTPFKKVGDANLALPKIDGYYREAGSYVPFGQDNLFPQLLNQLYYTSPLHGATIDFKTNATLGGGYEIEMDRLGVKGQVDAIAFTKRIDLKQTIKAVTKDILIHNRVYFLGCIDSKRNVIIKRRIAPEKIRKNNTGELFLYCDDWSRLMNIKQIKPLKYAEKGEEFLWSYEIPSVGQDLYSLPTYTSANNWIFLDGEMSYLQKSNILNSIFPAFAVKFPKKPQGKEELTMIKNTIEKLKGAENAGKAAAFFANRPEDLPSFETIATNSNDGLFQNTTESIENKICQAHTIDPILMGIRVSGKLGSGSDIKQSYIIFEKNVIMPLREEVEYVFNSLFKMLDLGVNLEIKDYQIINETIIESEDDNASAVSDALNAMSPLVATKVLDNLTSNEIRSLGGLAPIEGGDETASQKEERQNPQTQTGAPEQMSNDNLKGLSAKDNMDIIRIVRDYNKGKLNEALASTRLAAYGFDKDTITQILQG